MPARTLYPRYAAPRLAEALADSPAVLIHCPRQSGKTTLAQTAGRRAGYAYFTFDDQVTLEAATDDPVGFVARLPRRVILDEVQHVPHLFRPLKVAIDRERVAGRFILTGSTNVLLLPKLADSLAGRMAVLRLHPLAQCELARRRPNFLARLFGKGFAVERRVRRGAALADRMAAGGYPAALAIPAERRRVVWYSDYVETVIQRD